MSKDQTATIAELKARVQAFCSEREWDRFHGPKDLAIGAITEASELLEIFRFQDEAQAAQTLVDRREDIADELADVFIFLARFAARFDFDLADAVERKLEKTARKYPVEKSRGNNAKYDRL